MKLVEAVKTVEDIELVRRKLELNARGNTLYADIWMFGLQVAMRISDLLDITLQQALTGQLEIVEGKTGKLRQIKLNEKAQGIVKTRSKLGGIYLFEVDSNRAKGKPVSRVAVAKAFKAVGDEVGIRLGTHSMRKTRGWVMHQAGIPIEMICKVLNHSSPAITMMYLGITQAEIDSTYEQFVI
ncbi:tyrosine-type recombinase/integrase [Pseudomonas umsongensis]|uniref:Tyrosine-type recombinase/integrase n=1 Tax=Pseudomonas umsongensis TaxID=198618 RepID=A0AAE7DDB5_9PSED|nr:tyrosine-type recombinase/integrase [Pseudomonas umsongensis]QJC78208.1 tyrosine-type recombinase/integrase [Pseudomonas umsongensis]